MNPRILFAFLLIALSSVSVMSCSDEGAVFARLAITSIAPSGSDYHLMFYTKER